MERILIAAVLKAAGKLVRKHPLIATELVVSGATKGGKVGFAELRNLLQRKRERRRDPSGSLSPGARRKD